MSPFVQAALFGAFFGAVFGFLIGFGVAHTLMWTKPTDRRKKP